VYFSCIVMYPQSNIIVVCFSLLNKQLTSGPLGRPYDASDGK
jgi:hypothetical protein